ncbi:MAG: xanthine dehydrogenase family protein molybdopterin-binding subunit [Armatimonadota bacterium]
MRISGESIIGTSLPRVDAVEKVTGAAVYTGDLVIPGMGHGAVLRSPIPHGRIARIDTRRAEAVTGVLCVVTGRDLHELDPYYGMAIKDQPVLAVDRVRYEGEPVAAVAAVDAWTAREAAALIEVEYEDLPAVITLDDALAPGAPLVHQTVRAAGTFIDLRTISDQTTLSSNVCHEFSWSRGDITRGFAEADVVFDDSFTFPPVNHCMLESFVALARVERDGITVWASTQHPYPVRRELAQIFRLPQSKVRIIVPYVGGAYGAKSYTKIEPLAAVLSWKAGRPVHLALSMTEAFWTLTRHGARCRLRTGVKRDGTLVARECWVYYDSGAYADVGPRVARRGGYKAPGPYRIPHMRTTSYLVYTNKVPGGAYRGYAVPQIAWAYESQLDVIAEALKIDPVELRLRNLLRRGEEFAPGDLPIDGDLCGDLEAVAAGIDWRRDALGPHQGRGIGIAVKDTFSASISEAVVRLNADGSVIVFASTVEIGQGARTILTQIVAEELGVPPDQIVVAFPDTHVTPYDQATSASRSTVAMGEAVQVAARDVRRQLLVVAARMLEVEPDTLAIRDGVVITPDRSVAIGDVISDHFGMPGGELIGVGTNTRVRRETPLGAGTPFWEVGLGAAAVAVDPETGVVRVARYVTGADVGRALNPLQVEGQDEGAAMNGLGHTLFEEMVWQDGVLINPGLLDYRVPRFDDLPDVFSSLIIENRDGPGPFGSKGMGESGLMATAPAVARAIHHAVGARIKDLPLTPEKVWRAIKRTPPTGVVAAAGAVAD